MSQDFDVKQLANDWWSKVKAGQVGAAVGATGVPQVAQEYWLLGEAFIYAELNESKGKWDRLLIQNPDYMVVKRTVVANEPM
ncbi:MAG: hypothetical protein EBX09_08290, partial [Actinobacteria bacterium]|nr:hypothetical protein [Actinomycetota bacterium]